jgi:hypothetical protein
MSVELKLRIQDLEAALASARDPKKRARLQRELAACKRTDRVLAGAPDEVDDGTRTCPGCGEKVTPDADGDCPKCGEAMPDDDDDDAPEDTAADAAEDAKHKALLADPFAFHTPAEKAAAVAASRERTLQRPEPVAVRLAAGMTGLTLRVDHLPPSERAAVRRAVDALPRRGSR